MRIYKMSWIAGLLLALLALPLLAQSQDLAGAGPEPQNPNPNAPNPILHPVSRAILYTNGPFVTGVGGGFGGADVSALISPLTSYGFNCLQTIPYRLADDFTIPGPGSWHIQTVTVYLYQTGSTTTSTITGVYLQIWNGRPGDAGSSVVWGNTTTNVLAGSAWSNCYRAISTDLLASNRPIMACDATVNTTLAPGTYWLDWSATGSLASGPWNPPITIVGQNTTGNARQYATTLWQDVVSGTAPTTYPQGMPFVVSAAVGFQGRCEPLASGARVRWTVDAEDGVAAYRVERNSTGGWEAVGTMLPGPGVYTMIAPAGERFRVVALGVDGSEEIFAIQ